jgi:hypothetical protein
MSIFLRRFFAMLLSGCFLAFFTATVSARQTGNETASAAETAHDVRGLKSEIRENFDQTGESEETRVFQNGEKFPAIERFDLQRENAAEKNEKAEETEFLPARRILTGQADEDSPKDAGFYNAVETDEKLFDRKRIPFRPSDETFSEDSDESSDNPAEDGFRWKRAVSQSLIFLAVQHGYALTQPKTREALKGKFFSDYVESVRSLRGWGDGGRFFTNYIAHPMQGSLTGFIYVQNDPKARLLEFGRSGDYWKSRLKAMAWSAAWSTQFEIGPVSQASIGNVGLYGKQTWVDIVITPTGGTVWLVAEDALDRFVIKKIERRTDNFYLKIFARMLLNPTRVFANLIDFKPPWYRHRPALVFGPAQSKDLTGQDSN